MNESTLKKCWGVQLITFNARLNVGLLKPKKEEKSKREEPQTDEKRKNEWILELKTEKE
ncbi:hypothetical protein LEQ03_03985 [Riemerella anatipestifer]|nr:hypothetical protein LEQ05_11670 [Riemerella anatipestifer]WPC10546.1 hypothetical protein LEQ05_11675 [Riemerella anatipestifer]WPC13810.1 hypothetical protein LEQ03_03985 [Riemerella anatipestifer]